jgi:hypothetical protein
MYYLTFDGDGKTPVGEDLNKATDAFEAAVENHDWCPTLVDDEGVVLISHYSDGYDTWEYPIFIGPKEDPNPEPGIDRNAEEHEYRFGDWRL